jgi:transcriptional regulator with XRE-family HTH domain
MKRKTSNALEILQERFGNDPERQARLAEERIRVQAASAIYEARRAAGLTQKELADRIGTQQPVIARLEDADYEGHTLSMLDRIARALDSRVEVRFVPASAEKSNAQAPESRRKRRVVETPS